MHSKLLRLLAFISLATFADTPPQIINKICPTSQWIDRITPGAQPQCLQPDYTDIAGTLPIVPLATGVSGNLATSHLNSGTGATSSTFWRGDGSWAAPTFTVNWGTIVGTISNQTDLQTEFATKQDTGNYITALTGDVSASGPGSVAATVNSVGGSSASSVHSAEIAANAATNSSTPSTIVKRDSSGNFAAGTVTAALSGNATTATSLSTPGTATTVLHGNAAGAPGYSSIVNADVDPSAGIVDTKLATIATAGKVSNSATTATDANTASTIVARDASGNFTAGSITAALVGNASTATTASTASALTTAGTTTTVLHGNAAGNPTYGSVSLTADVSGNLPVTNLDSGTSASSSTFWRGDGTWAVTPINGITALTGDVSASGMGSVAATVNSVGGSSASAVNTATIAANAATDANTVSTIVKRDGSGNFTAGTITAALSGNATTATTANALSTAGTTTTVLHGNAAGNPTYSSIVNADVDAAAAIVDTKLATIATAGKVSNSATTATSANTASAIVARDGSGNFTAGTITANLTGNATSATTASSATTAATASALTTAGTTTTVLHGNAAGNPTYGTIVNADVDSSAGIVDTKLATIATAGKVSNSATTATSANTNSAIVARDGSGNFTAGTITAALSGNATTATSATTAGSATTASTASALTTAGTTTTVLHGNAAGNPTYGTVVNGDVDSAAAIAYSKLATLNTGQVLLGNAGTPTATSLSGDVTVGATGVTAIGAGKVTNTMLAGSIDLATKVTGNLSVNNLNSGTSASGSTYWRGDGTWATVGNGTVTSVDMTVPGILTVSGNPITTSGTLAIGATGTSGGVPYFSSTTALGSSALLTNHALVLGGGAGAAPKVVGSLGTSTTLLHGASAGDPTFSAVDMANDVTGTLAAAQFPALTGDITTSAGALATTAAATQANIATLSHSGGVNISGGIIGQTAAPGAGFLGQEIKSTIAPASGVSLSTSTAANVTSIVLTAGVWDLTFNGCFTGAPTSISELLVAINTTSATLPASSTEGDQRLDVPTQISGSDACGVLTGYRAVVTSGTTTYFAIGFGIFSGGTGLKGYGKLRAVRVD